MSALNEIAKSLIHPEKGIFAADWSIGTAEKKFAELGIECTEESRRRYREMLFSASELEKYISGVILHDETIRQNATNGKSLLQVLKDKGILVGIRVDAGQVKMPGNESELISEGMDKMREKLDEYKKMGADFAKWRAVYTITDKTPSRLNLEVNILQHALYAKYCHQAGILPIVEPDVIISGTHTLNKCAEVTKDVLAKTFMKLWDWEVDRKEIILKPNMITPGKESKQKVSSLEIAKATVEVMKANVPVDVPGIALLSGGQTPEDATNNLNEINKISGVPWQITFSYARAIQGPVLAEWGGKDENVKKAQDALIKRAKLNSLARQGKYESSMENL